MSEQLMQEQSARLNPFSLTMTQNGRFLAMAKQRSMEDANMWECVKALSDDDIDYIKNGARGAVNLPHRIGDDAVECDDGFILTKQGALVAPYNIVGDDYSAGYFPPESGKPGAYIAAREVKKKVAVDKPRMILLEDGHLEWGNNPTQAMKNKMDIIVRSLKRAVSSSTVDGKPWREWRVA